MDKQIVRRLVDESDRLNRDESSEWSFVEALWRPYVAQGEIEAEFHLAYIYFFGSFEEEPQKRSEMEALIRKAADQGHPEAMYRLSHLYPDGSERDALLLKAGDLGSLEAQRDLGALYATGDWTGPRDLAMAVDWYRRAAERGHADAQYNLGFMYLLGERVASDSQQGLHWLYKSADQGEEPAFRLLVDIYRNGYYGVVPDSAEADRWDELFQKSISALQKERAANGL